MRCAYLDGLSCKPKRLDNALSLNPVKGLARLIDEKIYLVDQYASQPVLVWVKDDNEQMWSLHHLHREEVRLLEGRSEIARMQDCEKEEEGAQVSRLRLLGEMLSRALWRAAFRRLFALRFSTPLKHCWWFASSAGPIDFWGCLGNVALMYTSTTCQAALQRQIVYLVAFGWWTCPAGGWSVHDRIPGDSCESRFNITALKRPSPPCSNAPWSWSDKRHFIASLLQPLVLKTSSASDSNDCEA